MGQDERRLVLHVQVAGEVQRRNALHRVREYPDGDQVRLERHLVICEDRSRRDRERVLAVPATPLPARLDEVVPGDRTAARANHLIHRTPTQIAEEFKGVLVLHVEQALDRERSGFGGKKEMLGHDVAFGHVEVTLW